MQKERKNQNEKKSMRLYIRSPYFIVAGGVVFFLLVLFTVFLIIPGIQIGLQAQVLYTSAQQLKETVKSGDINAIAGEITKLEEEYETFKERSESVYWASFIPYVSDYRNGVEAGIYILAMVQTALEKLQPQADTLNLQPGNAQSPEEIIAVAMSSLEILTSQTSLFQQDIQQAQEHIDKINPERYPESLFGFEVRGTIADLQKGFQGVASFITSAEPMVQQVPSIVGTDGEKRTYLILFQNQYERRATGGFLTAYAVLTIDNGRIELTDSQNIYDLDATVSEPPDAPEPIKKYHQEVGKFYIRDSNLSPDFPESVALFDSLYEESDQRVEYDGVIALDAKILVDLLEIYGETTAGGVRFSSQHDDRCDCPQVIYTMFDMVGRPVGYLRENRKGILGQLMSELLKKVSSDSPAIHWPLLADMVYHNLQEKHILLYFRDREVQSAVEKLNFGGRVQNTQSDYLHINSVNFAGAKSNLFVSEDIQSQTVFENGTIKRKVMVEFRNPYEHSDCNLETGGLCLNATLRNWIRFYVPEGSQLTQFVGSQTEVQTYEELGKTVFEGFMTVGPEGKAVVTVEYTLPRSINADDYSLFVQKQPGVEDQELDVIVDRKRLFRDEFVKDAVVGM